MLNEDFRALAGTKGALGHDTMIRFTLAGVTRTADNAWFQDEGDREYMAALGWDQERYLNIYTNQAYLSVGYACLPHDCAGTVRDGIVLFHETVGGRDQAGEYPYDQGRNAVTMVGHYLGLLKPSAHLAATAMKPETCWRTPIRSWAPTKGANHPIHAGWRTPSTTT